MLNPAGTRPWMGALLALPLLLFLAAAVGWPLALLAGRALSDSGWEAVGQVLAAGRYRTALVNSLLLSGAAAVASVLLALGPAWMLAHHRFLGRDLLRMAISLPLTFSGVLVGFLMVVLLGRTGYSFLGLFLAYLYFEVPRAVIVLEHAFRRFPQELDAAARTLGAGALRRLLRVGLPLAAPALRSTLAVTFSAALGSFGVALILSRRFTVAPLAVYTEMTLNQEVAGALCLGLAAATILVD